MGYTFLLISKYFTVYIRGGQNYLGPRVISNQGASLYITDFIRKLYSQRKYDGYFCLEWQPE